MAKDTATRKWQITLNNPREKGFTHEKIKELFVDFKSLVYCLVEDITIMMIYG